MGRPSPRCAGHARGPPPPPPGQPAVHQCRGPQRLRLPGAVQAALPQPQPGSGRRRDALHRRLPLPHRPGQRGAAWPMPLTRLRPPSMLFIASRQREPAGGYLGCEPCPNNPSHPPQFPALKCGAPLRDICEESKQKGQKLQILCGKKGTVFRTKDENGVPFLTQLGTPGDVVGYAREVPPAIKISSFVNLQYFEKYAKRCQETHSKILKRTNTPYPPLARTPFATYNSHITATQHPPHTDGVGRR